MIWTTIWGGVKKFGGWLAAAATFLVGWQLFMAERRRRIAAEQALHTMQDLFSARVKLEQSLALSRDRVERAERAADTEARAAEVEVKAKVAEIEAARSAGSGKLAELVNTELGAQPTDTDVVQ